MKLTALVREANLATEPERSVAVRVAVGITVTISVVALVSQGFVRTAPTVAAIIGIPAGFVLSYRMRYSDALKLKALLAVALVGAVVGFVSELVSSFQEGLIDVQVPLAELFLWVQIIHSLHVPARRDLLFSLTSSGAMMAITAALSISSALAVFMVLWAISLLASLLLAYRSSITDLPQLVSKVDPTPITAGATRVASRAVMLLVVGSILTFLLLPSARATRALSFPAELGTSGPVGTPGSLSNPSLGDQGSGSNNESSFDGRSSFGYFGFADQLDTSLRGRPDDTIVMRVRASAPAFWRGQTFDTWDGVRWTISNDTTTTIGGAAPIAVPPTVGDEVIRTEEFIQTFYIEQPGPNMVFGAYRVSEVYFDARFLFQLPDGALRAGFDLGSGAVYTVISRRPNASEALLRLSDPLQQGFANDLTPFLQLPDDVPQRVLDLAQEITADAPTTYDKVRALENWMGANTTYSLDIPPLPDGADSVDHYLFETRQGFCEQIGTSLVVMLRSLGVPARLAVGFVPGDRNVLTGLYEVKASDAHSWAEVYFPGVGWQGFDPTAKVPLAGEFEPPATAGSALVAWLGANGAVATRWFGSALGIILIVGFGSMLANVVARIVAERKRKASRTWVRRVIEDLERRGADHDRPRSNHETLHEYVAALMAGPIPDPRLGDLADIVTAEAFGGPSSVGSQFKAEQLVTAIFERRIH